MTSVIDQIRKQSPAQRQQFIVEAFSNGFGELIKADPDAMRNKFRKMAATPFAFYRGSAVLFYADVARDEEPFLDDKTSRVWIQGDLHAENFGTYMNSEGILVFDVNDFDEAYVGPFTWDIKRLAASLTLIGYQKALSDSEIQQLIATVVRSYIDQVYQFARSQQTRNFALTLANTTGKLLELLQKTRLSTRIALLDRETAIENYDRRFILNQTTTRPVDEATRAKVESAFQQYLQTIPPGKRFFRVSYRIKDIVARRGVGIGSAGLPSYNILVEGPTEALENDILIYMKQAQVAAPSRVITDPAIQQYFLHNGHRTVISQRALQAYADPWLGYTALDGVGQLVAEVSPYTSDLDWDNVNSLNEIVELLDYLGRATAKVHCISDVDSDQTLVPFSTDQAIHAALDGREEKFVQAMIAFGEGYGAIVREDHRLFIDAFRNHQFPGI